MSDTANILSGVTGFLQTMDRNSHRGRMVRQGEERLAQSQQALDNQIRQRDLTIDQGQQALDLSRDKFDELKRLKAQERQDVADLKWARNVQTGLRAPDGGFKTFDQVDTNTLAQLFNSTAGDNNTGPTLEGMENVESMRGLQRLEDGNYVIEQADGQSVNIPSQHLQAMYDNITGHAAKITGNDGSFGRGLMSLHGQPEGVTAESVVSRLSGTGGASDVPITPSKTEQPQVAETTVDATVMVDEPEESTTPAKQEAYQGTPTILGRFNNFFKPEAPKVDNANRNYSPASASLLFGGGRNIMDVNPEPPKKEDVKKPVTPAQLTRNPEKFQNYESKGAPTSETYDKTKTELVDHVKGKKKLNKNKRVHHAMNMLDAGAWTTSQAEYFARTGAINPAEKANDQRQGINGIKAASDYAKALRDSAKADQASAKNRSALREGLVNDFWGKDDFSEQQRPDRLKRLNATLQDMSWTPEQLVNSSNDMTSMAQVVRVAEGMKNAGTWNEFWNGNPQPMSLAPLFSMVTHGFIDGNDPDIAKAKGLLNRANDYAKSTKGKVSLYEAVEMAVNPQKQQ
ncbi:MAG: hypothetical protein GY746_11155 [Gammaproteobacteria bacterium]|nr:hypothetical protein [Gammaproteobacteria bacterium]